MIYIVFRDYTAICEHWNSLWILQKYDPKLYFKCPKKKAFSASQVRPVFHKSRTVTCLFSIPFSTAHRWCSRQGWALQFFLGQEDLGASCWNLQTMGKDKMSRSLKPDFSSCLINYQSPNPCLSVFPISFIPLPFKTCGKLEVILGGFGGLENYYSLGPGNPGADSYCSELFLSPASVGVLRWQGMLSLPVPTQMCSA